MVARVHPPGCPGCRADPAAPASAALPVRYISRQPFGINHAERLTRRGTAPGGLDACASYTTSSLDATQFPDDDTTTVADQLGGDDVRLDLIEYRQDLGPAVEELPPREREILLVRFYGNMTQAQIGELAGISQMHVSRLLTRSLRHLRARLEAAG